MKFIIPDIIIPAVDEKTLRQYRCAKTVSDKGDDSDVFLAVTNRRIVQYSCSGSGKKVTLMHNEVYISEVGGLSLFRGKEFQPQRFKTLAILFCLLALTLAAALALLTPATLAPALNLAADLTYAIAVGVPVLLYLALALPIIHKICYGVVMSIVVLTKDLSPANISLDAGFSQNAPRFLSIVPYVNEVQKLYAELSALILDVQRFGPLEVLKYIDAEQDLEQPSKK